jgi:hypothetical protein
MMRTLALVVCVAVALGAAGVSAAAPAPKREPVTTAEFVARCKTEWEFCRVKIAAAMTELNAVREACIPRDIKRDQAAVRVAYTLEEALEESPDIFEAGNYKGYLAQIIALIWPCGVVS